MQSPLTSYLSAHLVMLLCFHNLEIKNYHIVDKYNEMFQNYQHPFHYQQPESQLAYLHDITYHLQQ